MAPTPPTTFTVTGTWYRPDGVTLASGTVTFTPLQHRDEAQGNIVAGDAVVAVLVNGHISQQLVVNEHGYEVAEEIGDAPTTRYDIPGTTNIDLHTYGPNI